MRRVLFFLLMMVFFSPFTASAQQLQAVVKEFSGKVEVKQPGQDWQPVEANMVVSPGATVSTGFASRLVLDLGLTRISIRPLTRMLLRELIKKDSTNLTSLTLRVGKVNVAVKAASGEKNDFTIRGPASTAAVRGTNFDYDANLDDYVRNNPVPKSAESEVPERPGDVAVANRVHTTILRPHEDAAISNRVITPAERLDAKASSVAPPQNDLVSAALVDQGDNSVLQINSGPMPHWTPASSTPINVTVTVVN